jgi:hypothetical protein
MSIRWKRGFFRAWVVFAVLWIAAAALIIRLSTATDPSAYEKNWDDVGKLTWMFLPPVLLLIFGSVVDWTIQGFRP